MNYYFMYEVMVNSVSDTYLLNLCRLLCSSPLPPLSFYSPSSDWHIADNAPCCGNGPILPILLEKCQGEFKWSFVEEN